jgi:hypothetical protein
MKETSKNNDKKTSSKKGKSLKEKVQRHLKDKNDVITEEDMKEVIVGVNAVDLQNPDEPTIEENDIIPSKIETPWNIVREKE